MTSKSVFLLDANVLIALTTTEHTLHERAHSWFSTGVQFATCPITQGALLRFQLRLSDPRSIADAKLMLQELCAHPLHQFWNDDFNYTQLPERGIRGHKQVTDAYLASLASAHGGSLATLDESLAALHKGAFLIR